MLRNLTLLLAFLAVFGQALAAASVAAGGSGLAHEIAHLQDDAHHHHDDGGLHLDSTGDNVFHVHPDGPGTVALPTRLGPPPAGEAPQARASQRVGVLPAPPPDDLLRPPKPVS